MSEKRKGQSRMDNPEKLATRQDEDKNYNKMCVGHLHTQDIRRRQTKQNIQHIKIR